MAKSPDTSRESKGRFQSLLSAKAIHYFDE